MSLMFCRRDKLSLVVHQSSEKQAIKTQECKTDYENGRVASEKTHISRVAVRSPRIGREERIDHESAII
jgi:hypothetical protein